MSLPDHGFDVFVERSAGALLGYGRALTGSDHDAWDLVQEALTRIGERWSRETLVDPEAYARTVMIRLNIDRLRRIRRDTQLARRGGTPESYRMPEVEPLDDWLIAALRTLTPHQRTALALRYVDDCDVAEIARRMGCRSGTVRSHLSRGLARLKDASPAIRSMDGRAER
ncbi:sigma-70 family RNA polymerase sigma factor [Microlunatus soli]|uniref:RNA polymerase sigma factor, sigma-70 family n=1 Tax=Microlunatus soli TaxID=630515 RepID=A0A1H1S8T3_9ACTN|nr:sigma-70 family RNA polymerase sigma factor [Microlunatus soli]SDS44385.1 RNA polymerase sigma factor, sigma-70 family [Microlunatus soli]